MTDGNAHAGCVDAWVRQVAAPLPAAQAVRAYEQAFAALWRRADLALGDVTLVAVGDRVLVTLAEQYPILTSLTVDSSGLRFDVLREKVGNVPRDQLAGAMRAVLLELLTVLGNLTAEILTPALHAELSQSDAAGTGDSPRGNPHGGMS